MEEFLQQLAASGPLGIVAAGIVYLVIYFQRKQTSEKRNDDTAQLQKQIDDLNAMLNEEKTAKKMLEKDINYLMTENADIKEDIKEIKNTLNSMALALERIAAKYDGGTTNK
jgi:septal ring factor EnvC (AmiA/AmiB activator)